MPGLINKIGYQIGLASSKPRMMENASSELKVGKYEEAELFASLPYAIVKQVITGGRAEAPEFSCPYRAELDKACENASLFDKITIRAVNNALAAIGKPLTKESYHAVIADVEHTKGRDPDAPLDKQAVYFREQAAHQRNISKAFASGGEHEGASMHNMLSKAFDFKASVAEAAHKASIAFSPRQEH
jgi:hypothetical protein